MRRVFPVLPTTKFVDGEEVELLRTNGSWYTYTFKQISDAFIRYDSDYTLRKVNRINVIANDALNDIELEEDNDATQEV